MAPYAQPDGLRKLLDRLSGLVVEAVETYARMGIYSGFITYEDWGMQNGLQMKIDTFREFYKPVYKRIADTCHKHKMHFFWHNCGYIIDMFPDMIEIGVDVLQLDQPRLMGHQKLIDMLGGKLCMWNTVDIQWSVLDEVTDAEIRREVADMLRIYDVKKYHGGFIAKHYPQPWDINLPPGRQRLIYEAFMENGCRSL
jgi:uroporphyrinogen-III decarboxylase